ncbi:MAG: hypothetical protein M1159_05255 [Candidatus Thermoplasmatota archaeon]|nr:hypothetical protein [Candidatus Thermoplasmatota archaeon]
MKLKIFITIFITIIALISVLITFLPLINESYSLKSAFTEPNEKGACLKYQFYGFGAYASPNNTSKKGSMVGGCIYLYGEGNYYHVIANSDFIWSNYSNKCSSCIASFLIYPQKIKSGEIAEVNGITGFFSEQPQQASICIDNTNAIYNNFKLYESRDCLYFLPTSNEGVICNGEGYFNQTKTANLLNDIYKPDNLQLHITSIIELNFALVKTNVKFTSLDIYYYLNENFPIVALLITFSGAFLFLFVQRVKANRKRGANSNIQEIRTNSKIHKIKGRRNARKR